MNSPVEEIKSRLDIVEFVQSYIRLQKAGINYRANCPFHTEKTPSFFVSPPRQIWHCFGCGKGGDIFKFLMEIEGHDFPEALKLLAERAGIVLRREDPALRSERNRLYDLCEEAAKIFERNLSLTPAVKIYLQERGMKEETVREFRVGFAPQSWDFLRKALGQKGFKKEEVEKAGLAIRSEDGSSWYDRFRSRIMFPITDANSRVIGFGGRIFAPPAEVLAQAGIARPSPAKATEGVAKYINTPQTLIYDKSRVLYGFNKAKEAIRSKNEAVVVEGYMDCIMSYQAGVKNTISVSGTALTPQQLKTLRRLCGTIISSFDTDSAGETATRRSLALAAEFDFERKIASIPAGKDPADAVKENPVFWQEAVEKAKPVVDFYFEKSFRAKGTLGVSEKKEISALLLPLISELSNEVEKAHWVSEVSRKLGVPEEAIRKELKRKPGEKATYGVRDGASEGGTVRLPTRRELIEERLLALLTVLKDSARFEGLEGHHLTFASGVNAELFGLFQAGVASVKPAPHLAGPFDLLRFKGEVLAQMTPDVEEDFYTCRRELEKECIRENLLKLGEEIERKEKEGNATLVTSLLRDFRALSEKLKTIS